MQTRIEEKITIRYTSEGKDITLAPQTAGSAGIDLRAAEEYTLPHNSTILVKTGLKVAIPKGYAGFVCTRSGMALKHDCVVLNSPGIIDSDYRGEIGVILHNFNSEEITIHKEDRIAQLLIVPYVIPTFVKVDSLDTTERGTGGFGSTGEN